VEWVRWEEAARSALMLTTLRLDLTESVFGVVLRKSIPTQIRQRILYITN